MYKRALAGSSAERIYLHMAATHERAGDAHLADSTYQAAAKKFGRKKAVWLGWLGLRMRSGQVRARATASHAASQR